MNLDNVSKTSYTIDELESLKLDFSHDEIIENLRNETEDFIKIFSIINLEKLTNLNEVEILFHHLTQHSTPIREATALKIEEIYKVNFFSNNIKNQLLKAIIDINPNVCRAMCNLILRNELLQEEIMDDLILKIRCLLDEIESQDKELGGFFDNALKIKKNHAKNKKLFSLYWYLEVLSSCMNLKNNSQVLDIVEKTIKFNDYTIREKTAKIIDMIENPPLELLQIARNDQNFYVKNHVCDKINFED